MQDYTVYIIRDAEVINYLEKDDYEGLKSAIADGMEFNFMTEQFNSESEALGFCAGLGYGSDERSTPSIYPLRSFEPYDRPFIELICAH